MPNSLKIGDTDKPRPPGHVREAGWFNAHVADHRTGCRWNVRGLPGEHPLFIKAHPA
jgi:hypothetical protein